MTKWRVCGINFLKAYHSKINVSICIFLLLAVELGDPNSVSPLYLFTLVGNTSVGRYSHHDCHR